MNNHEIILFLLSIQGIASKTILKLLAEFQSFDAIYKAGEEELSKILTAKQHKAFLYKRENFDPASQLKTYVKMGIHFYSILHPDYPKRLLVIPDPPLGIFVKGTLPSNENMTVSVIGARRNSYYGEKQTRILTQKMVEENLEIVSGMAKGIDGISQHTAILNGGRTYGILGCGVNICYPPENEYIFRRIPDCGGLISEYMPDTAPCSGFFPARNRIISGLGDVLVVTESRLKSGTLITVDQALEQGKEIFVLPGRIDDPLSIGCNRLISQGAHIILDPDIFIEELLEYKKNRPLPSITAEDSIHNLLQIQLNSCKKKHKSKETTDGQISLFDAKKQIEENQQSRNLEENATNLSLSEEEKILLQILDYVPQSLDTIYNKLNDSNQFLLEAPPISKISIELMNLCFLGLARQEHGTWFTKM